MNTERAVRGGLIAVGVLATARGAYLVLFTLPPRQWPAMLLWLAAGIVVHDLLLAPASLGLGRLLGRPVGLPVAGNALRGAWLGVGTALLVGLPLVVGAGQRANPTVIPGRPGLNLLLSLALVVVGAALVIVVNLVRVNLLRADRRPGRPTRS
jgi:hypothetical protein